MKEISLQEESLLFRVTYKEVLKWVEKGANALERVEFIREVKKDKGEDEHNIEILSDERLPQMHSATKHWARIVSQEIEWKKNGSIVIECGRK